MNDNTQRLSNDRTRAHTSLFHSTGSSQEPSHAQKLKTISLAEPVAEQQKVPRQPPSFKYFPNLPYAQRKLILISIIVFCLLIALGGSAVWWLNANTAPAVTLYRVGYAQTVNISIGGGGIIYPQQQFDLSYPATESVVSVPVKPGDYVKANQALVGFDPAQINVSLQQANADVQAAQNYLNTVQASGNAVTIAQAEQSYQLAKNRYSALVAQLSSGQLHNGNLTSPLSGIVTAVNVTPGEVAPANTTLITVMDIQAVLVHAKVPLTYLGQVQIGQSAVVTPSSLSTLTFNGTVSGIIPQVDTATDTFEVWISIPNKNMRLLPGMSSFARIQSTVKAFALPRLSVLSSEDASTVFVVNDQIAHLRQVQIVDQTVDAVYIAADLAPGDEVVLVGLQNLRDGQRVQVTATTS